MSFFLLPFLTDYKKTSLAPYVKVFEQFLEEMEKSYKGQRLKDSGKGLFQKDANFNPSNPTPNCFSDTTHNGDMGSNINWYKK